MVHTRKGLASAAVAAVGLLGMGCGSSNPLDGTWATAVTLGTFTGTEAFALSSDGSLAVNDTAMGSSCSGSWITSGFTWTATGTTITFAGTPACTGAITCGALSLSCSGNTAGVKAGSCTYTLSDNDDTLALTDCSGTPNVTLTRED